MKKQHLTLFVVGLALVFGLDGYVAAKATPNSGTYTQKDKEFYLTAEQSNFIRPGLELIIDDVTIPADLMPEVRFRITDPAGLPLDRDGIYTPGPVSTSFILSFIPRGEEVYVAYTTRVQTSPITGDSAVQASTDSGGSYTTVQTGEYIYKFGTMLPADYDGDVTHTLGVYARRDLREFDLDRYVTNELEHFVPSGMGVAVPRDIVTTETCNGRCHDPLAIHGGSRQEVGLCILCHNATQSIDPDTGSSVFMPTMIHKIHAGAELENGYVVIGYNQGVHDYGEVEYPAALNECESCHTGGVPTNDFPLVATPAPVAACDQSGRGVTTRTWKYPDVVELRLNSPDGPLVGKGRAGSQETGKWIRDDTEFFVVDEASGEVLQELPLDLTVFGCAGVAPGTFRGDPGSQHTSWMTNPSRVNCGSCHDDVNFETGENHSEFEFPVDNDNDCKFCHKPTSGVEYDRSVQRAHTVNYKSNQLGGVLVDILSVDSTGPGEFPMVTFSLSNKFGPLDPAELGRLRFSISGPNEDFAIYWQEDAIGALVPGPAAEAAGDPTWVYSFEAPIPEDALGSFSLGVEGRINTVVMNPGTDKEFEQRDQMQNFIVPFAVTDEAPVPRRMVVDDAKCENCHLNLSLHGNNRHDPQYCNTCHYPAATDLPERTDEDLPPQAIHLKYMIHKIHRGAELENGYVVKGHNGSVNDFSHVEYPGDLRNCDGCHVNNSQSLPLPAGLLPTATPRDYWDPMQPETSACLSCHDNLSAAAHAETNTGTLGEACSSCHGEGKEFAVEKLHAR